MKKKRLFTPGPTSVPEEILLEMAKPIMHHRTDEFRAIVKDVSNGLKYIFQTENSVFIIGSSGTGAMETAITNVFSKGEKIAVVCGGKFGERFAEIGNVYGLEIVPVEIEWGKTFKAEELEKLLRENPDIRGICTPLCETSTGTAFDIENYGKVISKFPDVILIVDGVSSVGAIPCYMDKWGIDVLITGSQKALMLPPGLSFIALSKKAWGKTENSDIPKYYFDLKKYKKAIEKDDFPFTIPVSLVIGLKRSVELFREYGLENLWSLHSKRANATRKGIEKMGLELLSENPSDAVTSIKLPEEIDGEKLVKNLRTKYGISVAGGQDKLKGKIIRISHLGYMDEFDVLTAIVAVGICLEEMGYKCNLEDGIREAKQVLFS
ncbi:MAG TPA: alanine--glyoxylate aminotransferase family protein [Candidatus Ratteibacteria bacterium]|nr:alanine--glyoxylate aminotransferase family protein [Candidatus Ratteibacteria bacterium]